VLTLGADRAVLVCHHHDSRLVLRALAGDVEHDVGDVVVGVPKLLPHEFHREVTIVVLHVHLVTMGV
jgi:hypothetical protein